MLWGQSHTLDRSRPAGFQSLSRRQRHVQECFQEAVTVTVTKAVTVTVTKGLHILSDHTPPTTAVHVHHAATATSPLCLPVAGGASRLPGRVGWVLRVGD